jgi:hypothetical protein
LDFGVSERMIDVSSVEVPTNWPWRDSRIQFSLSEFELYRKILPFFNHLGKATAPVSHPNVSRRCDAGRSIYDLRLRPRRASRVRRRREEGE